MSAAKPDAEARPELRRLFEDVAERRLAPFTAADRLLAVLAPHKHAP